MRVFGLLMVLGLVPMGCGTDGGSDDGDSGPGGDATSAPGGGDSGGTNSGVGPTGDDDGDSGGGTGGSTGDDGDSNTTMGTGSGSTATATSGPIEDCDTLLAAFTAESEAIRSCEMDDECGQELMGTSCGCTRNWVARTDADATRFYELIELAGTLGCDLGLGSTCDCPTTSGFVCDLGTCNWDYS